MGIRDFIQLLAEHRGRLDGVGGLSETERGEILREAETMVGMIDAAVRELESVIKNRRVNLPEEHALRFAQDVFRHLREEEEKVKAEVRGTGS
ncbi:MAG: hypothetical protein H0U91_12845 [Rubrobacter sp.]|nr:hypothetical protein [Rubrobacter sp.]MBA3950526.1 hypothetical protein [Rubrobacter sp.]MDQ3360262.1 hypothetical protein [Actinomycetota bacterium]